MDETNKQTYIHVDLNEFSLLLDVKRGKSLKSISNNNEKKRAINETKQNGVCEMKYIYNLNV